MNLKTNAFRHYLGITEIFAVLTLAIAPLANASLAPDWRDIGTIETLNIAGISGGSAAVLADGRQFLPLQFEGMSRAAYFSVDPSRKTLLISREFIAEHNLWEYKFEREINLPQAGGGVVAGDLVRFYVLLVGDKALKDVQAVICDDCNETAGQSLLDRL